MHHTDHARVSRTRRQRGYSWESEVVKRFNHTPGWKAVRLGSSSVALPDVLAINNATSQVVAIECKSGMKDTLYVPAKQITRCMEWTEMFSNYRDRLEILAFKFYGRARGQNPRDIHEFFKAWPRSMRPQDVACTYAGHTYLTHNKAALSLREVTMPFAPIWSERLAKNGIMHVPIESGTVREIREP